MNRVVRNVLAVLVGFVAGSLLNMGVLNVGPHVIPLPEGADVSTTEGVRRSMELFEPVNFLVPFLAHALGTLAGAFVAAKLAASHPRRLAMILGVLFLAGGVAAVSMIGGPHWFIATDLVLAYLPMGWLGGRLACGSRA